MDAQVSDRLGASIFYAGPTGAYTEIRGFPIDTDPGDDTAALPIDELPQRKRLKIDLIEIAKATGGRTKVNPHDRIKSAALGDPDEIWRPMSKKPRVAGRSVLFDIQRSTAQA